MLFVGFLFITSLVFVVLAPLQAKGQTPQTITWLSPTNTRLALGVPHELNAVASSGLPVTFRVASGPATISGNQLTLSALASVRVEAEQAGKGDHAPAAQVITFNAGFEVAVTRLGRLGGGGTAQALRKVGNLAYVAGWWPSLAIIDVGDPTQPKLMGTFGTDSRAEDVEVVGQLAFVAASGHGLKILDVSNPANPFQVGGYQTRDTAVSVKVAGQLAYVAVGASGLEIVNVANVANPTLVARYRTPGELRQVFLNDKLAFLADSRVGLQILDVSDPSAPVPLGTYPSGSIQDLTVIGSHAYLNGGLQVVDVSAPSRPVRVEPLALSDSIVSPRFDDGLAYLSDSSGKVTVFDVSNPSAVIRLNEWATEGSKYPIFLVEAGKAYVATHLNGMDVLQLRRGFRQDVEFDFSGPLAFTNAPLPLGTSSTSGLPLSIRVVSGPGRIENDHLILTNVGTVVVRVEHPGNDLYLPATPVERTIEVRSNQEIHWPTSDFGPLAPGVPYAMSATSSSGLPVTYRVLSGPATAQGKVVTLTGLEPVAVVAEQTGNGVFAPASLTNRINPGLAVTGQRLALFGQGETMTGIEVVEDRAYALNLSGGLQIYDVSRPEAPQLLGSYKGASPVRSVQIVGSRAYLASGEAGLEIVDVATPGNPTRLGGFDTPGLAQAVRVAGDRAVVADGAEGIQILDISNPAEVQKLGAFKPDGETLDVAVVGDIAYMVLGAAGLLVVDVRDPASPTLRGRYSSPAFVRRVAVERGLACLVTAPQGLGRPFVGLEIVNVVNPDHPALVWFIGTSANAAAVRLAGSIAYIADGSTGVLIVDVSNPAEPVRMDDRQMFYHGAQGVDVRGEVAFVANGSMGLQAIRMRKGYTQTLTFDLPPSVVFQREPLMLEATASSGLPANYQVVRGPAQLDGNKLVLTALGQVVVRAEQPGDRLFLPAGTRQDTMEVLPNQTLSWLEPTNAVLRLNQPHRLAAASSSGLPVTFRVVAGPATVEGDRLMVTDIDPVTVVVDQAGNEFYNAVSLTNRFNTNPIVQVSSLGRTPTTGPALRLKVQDGLAYVAEGTNGLQIYNVSLAGPPQHVGGIVPGESVLQVHVLEQRAYLAGNASIWAVDIHDPARPTIVGHFSTSVSVLDADLDVVGSKVFAAVARKLLIVDFADPTKPLQIGEFISTEGVAGVRVVGSVACLANLTRGLQILDISSPSAPMPLARLAAGSARALDVDPVSGLLMVCGSDGFRLVDVAIPSAPQVVADGLGAAVQRGRMRGASIAVARGTRVEISRFTGADDKYEAGYVVTNGVPADLALMDGKAVLANGVNGLEVIRFRRGYTQTLQFPPDTFPHPWVFTNAPLLLKAFASSGLPVTYSVEQGPAVVEGSLLRLTGTGLVTIRAEQSGDELFLPALPRTFSGIILPNQSLAIESPTNRTLALHMPHELRATVSSGRPVTHHILSGPGTLDGTRLTLHAVDPVVVVTEQVGDDVFQPVSLTNVFNARFSLAGKIVGQLPLAGRPRRLEVVGTHAYLATETAGLQIVDISNPSAPVRVGGITTDGTAQGLQVVGDLAYVADGAAGLQVFDVSTPSAPVRLGGHDTPGNAANVRVTGTLAHVADGPGGVQIFNVANASSPSPLGQHYLDSSTIDLAVVGSLVHSVRFLASMETIDANDPTKPKRLGHLPFDWAMFRTPSAVQVSGNVAFVAGVGASLLAVDVTYPSGPSYLTQASVNSDTDGRDLHVVGATAYVVGGERLDAFDVSEFALPLFPELGSIVTPGEPTGVRVIGQHAYVANQVKGLQVVLLQKRLSQRLNFSLPTSVSLAEGAVVLTGTSSLGLPVTYRVVRGPGRIVGDRLIVTNLGLITVEATQTGDSFHQAASPVTAHVSVVPPPLQLSAALASERIVLTLSGTVGTRVELQRTHDINVPTSWLTFTNVALEDGDVEISEPVTSQHFYRAQSLE